MTTPLKSAAIALLLVLGTAGSALAATAYADGRVRVRDEPRRSADTVDWLRDGERVEVEGCSRSYCFIEHRGPDGYVRVNDLIFERDNDDPDVQFCIGGGGGSGGGFGFGRFCIEN